jgi:hypothetical protein
MIMRVKIFSEVVSVGGDGESSPEEILEAKINGWLSGNPHIIIQDIRFNLGIVPEQREKNVC